MENLAGNWESLVLFLATILIHRVEQIISFFFFFAFFFSSSFHSFLFVSLYLFPPLPTPTPTQPGGWSYMVTVDMLYASSPLLVLFSYLETLPWTIAWINPVSASSWILLWAPLKPSSVCHLTFLCPLSTPARHGHYLFPTFLTDFPSCFESCSKYLVLFFCVSPSGSAHWLPWNSMNVGWLKGKTVMSTRQLSFFFLTECLLSPRTMIRALQCNISLMTTTFWGLVYAHFTVEGTEIH